MDNKYNSIFEKYLGPLTTIKAIIIIGIVGFVTFSTALFNSFVWDDKTHVLPSVISYGLNLDKLFASNTIFNSFGYYQPIAALYFSSVYSLFGS